MKIYIVGSVASGKTTLSKKLSERLMIECTHLDELVHIKDDTNKQWGNKRRSDFDIENLFQTILDKKTWLVEDCGRNMFVKAFEEADVIIHLDPSRGIRKFRITSRYIKQKLGFEYCVYRPTLKMLKAMYQWSNNYDSGVDDLKKRLYSYDHKKVVLKTRKEIRLYLEQLVVI